MLTGNDKELEFGSAFPDGRLTEPADGKRYQWRKMIDQAERQGRPLSEEEAVLYRTWENERTDTDEKI